MTSAAAVAAATVYGAWQIISPRRCDQRDDPASRGLPCEEVRFPATDGAGLVGWFAPAPSRGAAIIVVHGHGANRHTSLAFADFLYPHFSVLLPDLRGHGDSDGRHTSVGHLERRDVIGAARYLEARGYGPIGVLGVSMGASTAILAAADDRSIAAVVADSPFAALHGAVCDGARMRGYPGPIIRPLAYLSLQTAAWRLRHPPRAGDPLGRVASLAPRPLLLIHGGADVRIRPEHSRALYAAAREPKELWLLPGVEHAQAITAEPEAYRERVFAFFRRWLSPGAQIEAPSASRALEAGPLQVGQPAAGARPGQVHQVA